MNHAELLAWYKAATTQDISDRKWTDRELDHLTAIVVRGWTIDNPFDLYYITSEEPRLRSSWNPSTDMNDAKTVAEAIFYYWKMEKDPDDPRGLPDYIGWGVKEKEFFNDDQEIWFRADTPEYAICIAALIAEKEGNNG